MQPNNQQTPPYRPPGQPQTNNQSTPQQNQPTQPIYTPPVQNNSSNKKGGKIVISYASDEDLVKIDEALNNL